MRLTPVAQWADSGFDTIDLLHVIAQKLQFLVNFRVIFVAILVFLVLPDFSKTKTLWEV